jgi:Leucine-rich repeat (LRR) protein
MVIPHPSYVCRFSLILLAAAKSLIFATQPIGRMPACEWDGIICDPSTSSVSSIQLQSADLFATIPSELGTLHTLRTIMMRENLLYGPIPSEVAALPKLEIFDVAENALTGNLPYFSSGQLDKLDISRNKLSGFIPSNLGHNHELMTSLDVMHNRMSGPLPPSLDRMKNLELLSISNNGFWGVLPTSLGNLPQLTFLYADNNNFVGPIPSNLARPLGSGGKGSLLEEIWVQQNELSGTLPASLADLSQLQSLYIDGNKFTGKVPGDLCSEDLNVDFFDGVAADMERNLCDSVACPVDTTSLEGVFPCSPCRSLHYNPYLGRTGKCIALGQRLILSHFYDATSQLGQWIGGSNWNDDKTPLCDFDGITCDSKDNVVEIKLPARGLTGTVPEEIGFLEYLEVLDVSDNQLTGFLPSDLRWAPLRKLDISGNRMKSVVPPMLCLKQGINGNGQNGDYNCQRIACPAGTFSPSGMMAGDYGEFFCVPCEDEDANFLGRKQCATIGAHAQSAEGDKLGLDVLGFLNFLVVLSAIGIAVGVFIFIRMRREKYSRGEAIPQRDDDGGANEPTVFNSAGISSLPYSDSEGDQFRERRKMPSRAFRDGRGKSVRPKRFVTSRDGVSDDEEEINFEDSLSESSSGDGSSSSFRNSLEGEVRRQKEQGSNTPVWAYPDPLEDSRNRSSSWSAEKDSSKEVWLDVPKI